MTEAPSPAEVQAARLDELRAMLAAREGRPGYKTNVAALRAEIRRLERLGG